MGDLIRRSGRFVFGRVMPRIAYPVLTGPLRGVRFVLGAFGGEGGGATVYFNQIETEQTAAMINELRKATLFLDVGANCGYYSILASRVMERGSRVISFEPSIRNLAYLQKHIELNAADNVLVIAAACANENSFVEFSTGRNSAMGYIDTAGSDRVSGASLNGKSIVPTVRLDDLARRYSLSPDVIKIDVEGAELEVLKGAREILEAAPPAIFLSTHSAELRTSCTVFLSELGYELRPLIDGDCHEFLAKIPERPNAL